MFLVQTEETFVQLATRLFQHADNNLDARIAEHLYAASRHQRIGIQHANHYAADTLLDDQFGARRRLAIVGTGFERDEECAIF